jgi:hypothetical protein
MRDFGALQGRTAGFRDLLVILAAVRLLPLVFNLWRGDSRAYSQCYQNAQDPGITGS